MAALLTIWAADFFTSAGKPRGTPAATAEQTEWVLERSSDHPGMQATCVALDPAGRRVAVGNRSGEVGVWEADGPRLLWRWPAHPTYTTAVAFTPDGEMALSAGSDMVLRLWILAADGPILRAETATEGRVLGIAVAPDGRSAATGSVGSVTVWQIGEAGLVPSATTVADWPVHVLVFSPDGARLAFSAGDNVVRVWRPSGNDGPSPIGVSEDYQVRGLGFAPDGRELTALDTGGQLLRWDLVNAERHDVGLAVTDCRAAAFATDLRRVVIAHVNGSVRLVARPGGPADY
jgi:WD40 repeat protein